MLLALRVAWPTKLIAAGGGVLPRVKVCESTSEASLSSVTVSVAVQVPAS